MTTDAEPIAELVRGEAAKQMSELKRHEHLRISSSRKADYWNHPDIRYVVRDTRTGERVGRRCEQWKLCRIHRTRCHRARDRLASAVRRRQRSVRQNRGQQCLNESGPTGLTTRRPYSDTPEGNTKMTTALLDCSERGRAVPCPPYPCGGPKSRPGPGSSSAFGPWRKRARRIASASTNRSR
jgi:hypothetical protein